ncbi:hypothetical protein [Pseudomonas sp. UBA4194]|uniref:hypothetical protein n=1 Tax=Pseudomonas sp. UBA4194 TaxID=1947317 RepID=UPI0025E5AC79|nr:hypothetical protein [Pseudomonas sp. UBA4194]
MAVRLDHVPAPAWRPDSPRLWRWLTLLLVLLIVGVAQVWLFADQGPDQPPGRSWAIGLVLPALVWAVLLFVRWIVYVGGHQAADAWDAARETDLWQRRRCGRRSQQVLGVSLHTALRTTGSEGPQAQLQGLRSGQAALRSQARSLNEAQAGLERLHDLLVLVTGTDIVPLMALRQQMMGLVERSTPGSSIALKPGWRLPDSRWKVTWRWPGRA